MDRRRSCYCLTAARRGVRRWPGQRHVGVPGRVWVVCGQPTLIWQGLHLGTRGGDQGGTVALGEIPCVSFSTTGCSMATRPSLDADLGSRGSALLIRPRQHGHSHGQGESWFKRARTHPRCPRAWRKRTVGFLKEEEAGMSPWRGCVGQSVPLAPVAITLRQSQGHRTPSPRGPGFHSALKENETRGQVGPSSVDPACPPGSEFRSLSTFSPR